MAADAIRETINKVFLGEPVIINWGCGPSRYNNFLYGRDAPMRVAIAARKGLRDCLETGYLSETVRGSGEGVIVAAGRLMGGVLGCHLYEHVYASGQDCVALFYPERGTGFLFGPYSDEWGDFKMEHFIKPSWLSQAEQKATS
jgi:hypothetical protein